VREVKKLEILERAQALLAEKPFSKQNEAEFKSLMILHDAMEETENEKANEDALNRVNAARQEMGIAPADLRSNKSQASHKEQRDALYTYMKTGELRGLNTTTGSAGGFLIPADFQKELFKGIAQYSDLLNEDNVHLLRTKTGSPITVPGFDLSTVSCQIIGQGSDLVPGSVPTVTRNTLGGYTYRCTPIAATLEIEQDSFEDVFSILNQAFSVGLSRGIGSDLVNGNGTTAPMGLLNAAANSGVTTAAYITVTADEINSIYFSLNRVYRRSPKCAWVMNDQTWQFIRRSKDANQRPLIDINLTEEGETLMGKRVLISPDMPTSAAGAKHIIFGDLSQFVVRVAGDSIAMKRSFEYPGMAEQGAALYTAYMRVDSALIAPGGVKPVVYATHV
jgi:HK97 family phage major capsid protein